MPKKMMEPAMITWNAAPYRQQMMKIMMSIHCHHFTAFEDHTHPTVMIPRFRVRFRQSLGLGLDIGLQE
jgi:hypothetical protein